MRGQASVSNVYTKKEGIRMKTKFSKMREYWRRMMESTQRKLSQGAQNISRVMTWGHKDNWRRKNEKK